MPTPEAPVPGDTIFGHAFDNGVVVCVSCLPDEYDADLEVVNAKSIRYWTDTGLSYACYGAEPLGDLVKLLDRIEDDEELIAAFTSLSAETKRTIYHYGLFDAEWPRALEQLEEALDTRDDDDVQKYLEKCRRCDRQLYLITDDIPEEHHDAYLAWATEAINQYERNR